MRNFDLSPLYRSAIGFDRLFNLLENNQGQSNGGYPPLSPWPVSLKANWILPPRITCWW